MDIMKELTDGKLDETLNIIDLVFMKLIIKECMYPELDLLENLAMKFCLIMKQITFHLG